MALIDWDILKRKKHGSMNTWHKNLFSNEDFVFGITSSFGEISLHFFLFFTCIYMNKNGTKPSKGTAIISKLNQTNKKWTHMVTFFWSRWWREKNCLTNLNYICVCNWKEHVNLSSKLKMILCVRPDARTATRLG